MNKTDAITLMKKGEKLTHRYFSDGEFITMKDDWIIDEDGNKLAPKEFWSIRIGEAFERDWSLFNREVNPLYQKLNKKQIEEFATIYIGSQMALIDGGNIGDAEYSKSTTEIVEAINKRGVKILGNRPIKQTPTEILAHVLNLG